MTLSYEVSCWTCTNIISRTLFALLSKLCWANFFLPTPVQLREIHHCQPVDQKWRGGENDRYSKSKEGEGGWRWCGEWGYREIGARQWAMVGSVIMRVCVCVWVGVVGVCVCVCMIERETERGPWSRPWEPGTSWTLSTACWFCLPSRSLSPLTPFHKTFPFLLILTLSFYPYLTTFIAPSSVLISCLFVNCLKLPM